MNDMINPYIAGAPVIDTRMFFGRADVFDWIQNSLTGRYADHILVIHGQRRVGKTSVLKQLGNRLPEKYIPVFFDLQGRTHTTLDRFLWWLAREIVRVLKQDRNITFPAPEKEVFISDPEYFENYFLLEMRSAIGEHALLLTFDEFDNLEEREVKEELAQPLIDYLRRMMGQAGLNFIFSIGSSGRKLENMQAAYTEFFKTALYKKISFLSKEQSFSLVTNPVEGLLEYDLQAVERIYGITSGHPYFTQLTCHELFSLCQRTGQLRIQESDVEAVLDDVVERGTVNLKFSWDEAVDIEKWALVALAHEKEVLDNHALAESLRRLRVRFSEPDLTSGILHLREKDILTGENRFVIYLLKLWLKRNRPIEQVREELTETNPIANRFIEIGMEFQDAGHYDRAIENFRQALEVAPEHIQAQVNIALAYMAKKELAQAVVEFEKALAADDEDVTARAGLCSAHLALGDAARQKGRLRDAVQSYQKVLDINAEHTEARGRMAELSRQRAEKALVDGRDEEALAAFSEALKFTPEDETLARRYEQAKVEKRTKVVGSLLVKAEKEQSARNWVNALAILQNALEIDPQNENIQKQLVTVKEEQRKEQSQVILARAGRAEQAGQWRLVLAALGEYLALEPEDVQVQSRLEEARQNLAKAVQEDVRSHAHALVHQERFKEALTAWEEYRKANPEEDQAVQIEVEQIKKVQALAGTYSQAQTAFAKKNYDFAIGLFKEIVIQDENYKDASRRMAEAIELRRTARKWWHSKWLWAGTGFAILMIIVMFAYKPVITLLSSHPSQPADSTQVSENGIPNITPQPTRPPATLIPTATVAEPLPTPIPLSWTRLSSAQFLPRDAITAIVLDPNDPGVMYIGTENAGVYKSIDGGSSWQPIHNGLRRAAIKSMVFDPKNSMSLYVGTSLGGVYKSVDGGMNWNETNHGITSKGWERVSIVAIAENNVDDLLYTQSEEIFGTLYGGNSWQLIKDSQTCPRGIEALARNPSDDSIVYAVAGTGNIGGCSNGVYQSLDRSDSWTRLNLEEKIVGVQEFLIDPYDINRIYINDRGSGKLFISRDAGKTWSGTNGCDAFNLSPEEDTEIYCAVNGNFLKSTDDSATWKDISKLPSKDIRLLSFSPQSTRTVLLGGQGLWISSDGGLSWTESSNGLGAMRVEASTDLALGNKLYLDDNLCLAYQSSDAGRKWEYNQTFGCGMTMNGGGVDRYWLDSDRRSIHTSINSGSTWKAYDLPALTHQLIAHPTQPGRVYAVCEAAAPTGIYTSRDYGQTWHITLGIEKLVNGNIYFQPGMQERIYAVSQDFNIYRSDDYGENWVDCRGTDSYHAQGASRLAFNPRNSEHLILATRGEGIKVSLDGCKSWTPSNNGLGSLFVNAVVADPNNPDVLYAGTDSGIYISSDAGQNWGVINDGLLGATVVYSIVVDKDSIVYAATPYGIFSLEGK